MNTGDLMLDIERGVITKCPNCNIMSKEKEEMNYHIAKKHAQPNSKQSMVRPSCEQEFASYYSLQQHRKKKNMELSNENLVIQWRTYKSGSTLLFCNLLSIFLTKLLNFLCFYTSKN